MPMAWPGFLCPGSGLDWHKATPRSGPSPLLLLLLPKRPASLGVRLLTPPVRRRPALPSSSDTRLFRLPLASGRDPHTAEASSIRSVPAAPAVLLLSLWACTGSFWLRLGGKLRRRLSNCARFQATLCRRPCCWLCGRLRLRRVVNRRLVIVLRRGSLPHMAAFPPAFLGLLGLRLSLGRVSLCRRRCDCRHRFCLHRGLRDRKPCREVCLSNCPWHRRLRRPPQILQRLRRRGEGWWPQSRRPRLAGHPGQSRCCPGRFSLDQRVPCQRCASVGKRRLPEEVLLGHGARCARQTGLGKKTKALRHSKQAGQGSCPRLASLAEITGRTPKQSQNGSPCEIL